MEDQDKKPAAPKKTDDELAIERVVKLLKKLPNGNSIANKVLEVLK